MPDDTKIAIHFAFVRASLSRVAALAVMAAVATTAVAQINPQGDAVAGYRPTPVFVENRGQWDGGFTHRISLGAMTVFLERNGWTLRHAGSGRIAAGSRMVAPVP